jgi:hypothetical protein
VGKIEDAVFTERNLRLCGCAVIAAYLALAWQLFNGDWLIHSNGRPACIDFSWIWTTGSLAATSDPGHIYDHSAFQAALLGLVGPNNCGYLPRFGYPPTFLLFTYALGLIPYSIAFAGWISATFLLYEAAIYAIIPRPLTFIAAATPFPVLINVGLGHNGFLTAGLFGLSLVLMERRPLAAGSVLALLTYKPQFGILFPLSLLAARNWRTLAAAAAASVVLAAATSVAFGYEGWPNFIDALLERSQSSTLNDEPGFELRLQSLYYLFSNLGAGLRLSGIGHLAIAASVIVAVCTVWSRPLPHSLKAAALCTGSVMISPYVMAYDLCVLSVAVAFLVKDGLARGFLPGERWAVLLAFGGLFLIAVPIAPLICTILFALIARRIVWFPKPPVAEARARL